MRYQITGRHLDIGNALQEYVREELASVLEKYGQRPTDAEVIFSKDAHNFVCEATVHLSTGMIAAAKASATEIYAAFDLCRDKMEKQLRRYKRRLKAHQRRREHPVELSEAATYILAPSEEKEDTEPESLTPMIIAEMETKIASLSVGEAVMQMELSGAPLLVFRNEAHKGINVIYRRDDGNIGWIDPKNIG